MSGGHPWLVLGFIALAQMMVALDTTIVNIALPTIQRALQFGDTDRQWVVTAYTTAFGGLLLLGGRIADTIGRGRAFAIGLAGFATASALGGGAPNFAALVIARALQGMFAALLVPATLALLSVTFTERRQRAKAFAVYGGIAGSGAVLGLVLGGAITQSIDWRWCFFINLPLAVVAFVGGRWTLPAAAPARRGPLDVPSALLASAGIAAPLLPPHIVLDRNAVRRACAPRSPSSACSAAFSC